MAKYIEADRLKEEFQKRFDICKRVSEDDRNALDTQDWYRGKYTAYSECLSFIDSLSEEPDKSLEEAAEEYASINCDDYVDYDSNICFIEEGMRVAFKAGAEWQKEKMLKEAVEGEAEELYNDGESQCTVGVGTYFKPGEKVYVLKAEEEQK